MMIKPSGTTSPHSKMEGEPKEWFRNLRSFGEVAIVLDHANKKLKGKLEDRGFPCMFVGYSDNHAGNVYRFINLKTQKIIHSRDVAWLQKFWGEYVGLKTSTIKYLENNDEDEVEILHDPIDIKEDNEDESA